MYHQRGAPGCGDPCILGVAEAVRDAADASEDGVFTSQDVHRLLVERRAYDPDDLVGELHSPQASTRGDDPRLQERAYRARWLGYVQKGTQ